MAHRVHPHLTKPYKPAPPQLWSRQLPALLILLGVTGCKPEAPAVSEPQSHQAVVINDRAFQLELALDTDTQFQGLSDRDHIDPDGGMLFVFPEPRKAAECFFVMRRCLVPIDIIFLDPNGRVTATHAMQVEPYDRPEGDLKRYGSRYTAQFAVELAGGTLETLGLSPGDPIDLPLDDLKARAR